MKKAYLYNNYVVIEDGTNTFLFNIYNSFTVVNANDYTVQSAVGNRAVILIADATNWYDETGTIPFDADSLLLFLETYTGQFPQPTSSNGLPTGGTAGQILAKIDATNFNAEWIDNYANWTSQLKHEVKAGESLVKGQAVYVSSADGTNMIVSKASNASESTSSKTMGLIAQSLSHNAKGFVITEGLLAGLNTSTANAGDPVWLGTNGNLIYGIANKPHAPEHLVFIGIVTRSNNSNGEIFVKVQNGFELEELHNVAITSPVNKNTILFNSTTSLWENRLIEISDVTNLQTELNGKVAGSGTTNHVSKFTASGTIGDSLIYDDGTSVGIGSTVLQSKFHIFNNAAPSFNAVTGYNSMKLEYDGGYNEDDFGSGITFFQKWYSLSSLKVATGGIFGVKTNGDGNFGGGLSFFYTGLGSSIMSEGMRLSSSGYFGIGSIYPATKFHVRDGDGNFYVGNSFAKIENAGGVTASFYLADSTDSVALKNIGANLLFFNSSTESMRLTQSGFLGIKTTNPSYELHVIGQIQTFNLGIEASLFDAYNSAGTSDQFLSSQGSFIAWKSLKTINGNSIVGSGDVSINGGLQGIHAIIPLASGAQTLSSLQCMTGGTGQVFTANRLIAYPFIPNQSFTTSNLQLSVVTLGTGSLGRIAVYSDLNGVPDTSIFISSDLDFSTTGLKTVTTSISFVAGTTYWLAFHGSATTATLNALTANQMMPIKIINPSSVANYVFRNLTFTSGTPTTFGSVSYASGNIPIVYITKA